MENVKYFAQANQMLIAVKMYREITGASLEEALASVERINASSD
jgi:ribosomal protein L7/L12